MHVSGLSILEISQQQVQGRLPESVEVSGAPAAVYALGPLAFALFSPLGLFATYLVVSSIVRLASSYIDEAHGDPILTGVDALSRRGATTRKHRTERGARAKLERPIPNGLRTVYPLTLQTTPDVVRRAINYDLPPLRLKGSEVEVCAFCGPG
jgi:hypothetical protein